MSYFYTCPRCGCNLDPGENCDCTDTKSDGKKDGEMYSEQRTDENISEIVA